MAKKKSSPKDAEWARAKKLCRLNQGDVRMAKELGFQPKSLIKNIPAKSEPWKAPVKEWIRDLYQKRFGKIWAAKSQAAENSWEKLRSIYPPEDVILQKIDENRFLHEESILDENERSDEWIVEEFRDDSMPPDQSEIDEENRLLVKRWREFRMAADYVANAYGQLPEVEKIVLFGSIAVPLKKEIPRFRKFRRMSQKRKMRMLRGRMRRTGVSSTD